jgi:hypothetical protein
MTIVPDSLSFEGLRVAAQKRGLDLERAPKGDTLKFHITRNGYRSQSSFRTLHEVSEYLSNLPADFAQPR